MSFGSAHSGMCLVVWIVELALSCLQCINNKSIGCCKILPVLIVSNSKEIVHVFVVRGNSSVCPSPSRHLSGKHGSSRPASALSLFISLFDGCTLTNTHFFNHFHNMTCSSSCKSCVCHEKAKRENNSGIYSYYHMMPFYFCYFKFQGFKV